MSNSNLFLRPESLFGHVATFVTVDNLKSPLGHPLDVREVAAYQDEICQEFCPKVFTGTAYALVCEIADDPDDSTFFEDQVHLVLKDGEVAGWISLIDLVDGAPDDSFLEDDMRIVRPSQIITAGTPFWEALQLFAETNEEFFFVMDRNAIRGTLRYDDLFKEPGRLCMFALTLELETAALELCRHFALDCFKALSEDRAKKAIKVSIERFTSKLERALKKGRTTEDLIQEHCRDSWGEYVARTTFIDKGTMIAKCKLLIDVGRTTVENTFTRAERVRNACAHTVGSDGFESVLERKKLKTFLAQYSEVIDSIVRHTPKSG